MSTEHDFEVLYRNEPGYVRANANLPGGFVFAVSSLEMEADEADKFRELMEHTIPGYCKKEACIEHDEHWTWRDFGIPDEYNPLKVFITPYLQISRADGMKGSEQVVRGFQGFRPEQMEGMGDPNLTPKQTPGTTVLIQNGIKEVRQKRGLGAMFGGRR